MFYLGFKKIVPSQEMVLTLNLDFPKMCLYKRNPYSAVDMEFGTDITRI